MRVVGPLFLPWVQEAIRDEEVAVIFLKEFWPRIVGASWRNRRLRVVDPWPRNRSDH